MYRENTHINRSNKIVSIDTHFLARNRMLLSVVVSYERRILRIYGIIMLINFPLKQTLTFLISIRYSKNTYFFSIPQSEKKIIWFASKTFLTYFSVVLMECSNERESYQSKTSTIQLCYMWITLYYHYYYDEHYVVFNVRWFAVGLLVVNAFVFVFILIQ